MSLCTYPSGHDPDGLWLAVLRELRGQLLTATFEAWLPGSQALPAACTPVFLVIVVPHERAQQWLTYRLYPAVARTAAYLACGPVTLCFVNRSPAAHNRSLTTARLPHAGGLDGPGGAAPAAGLSCLMPLKRSASDVCTTPIRPHHDGGRVGNMGLANGRAAIEERAASPPAATVPGPPPPAAQTYGDGSQVDADNVTERQTFALYLADKKEIPSSRSALLTYSQQRAQAASGAGQGKRG